MIIKPPKPYKTMPRYNGSEWHIRKTSVYCDGPFGGKTKFCEFEESEKENVRFLLTAITVSIIGL